jgi:broad specificity phosphatase PhoE
MISASRLLFSLSPVKTLKPSSDSIVLKQFGPVLNILKKMKKPPLNNLLVTDNLNYERYQAFVTSTKSKNIQPVVRMKTLHNGRYATRNSTHTFRRHFHRAKRIILIRHGESEGNVDESAYVNTADWQIRLTKKGKEQAHRAGKELRKIIKEDESIFFYVSPYKRTLQTLKEIQQMFPKEQVWGVREEPRIAEQQFGNFQNVEEVRKAKIERKKFGRFFFRFPNGESGLDVYSRTTSFLSTLFRDSAQMRNSGVDLHNMNIVIVTHGLAIRLFLMRWFQYSVDDFEDSYNPANGSLNIMERHENEHGEQWFEIEAETKSSLNLNQVHQSMNKMHGSAESSL